MVWVSYSVFVSMMVIMLLVIYFNNELFMGLVGGVGKVV